MIKQMMMATAFATGTVLGAVPAASQVTLQEGLVAVSIGDISILENFLNDTQIAALNNVAVPIKVQVPVSVAANVCGVTVGVLSEAGSAAACNAKSGSQALATAVVDQVLNQKK